MSSPLKTLLGMVTQYDSLVVAKGIFTPQERIVRLTIRTTLKDAIAAKMSEVQAEAAIMGALSRIPLTDINSIDLQMLCQFIYSCPSSLQYMKGDLFYCMQINFMNWFYHHDRGKIADHLVIETYSDANREQLVKDTLKQFSGIIAANTEATKEEKKEGFTDYNVPASNILLKYNHLLDDNEFSNYFDALCFCLAKKRDDALDQSIFEDLMGLMPRLTSAQLIQFYEVLPKSVLSGDFCANYKVPLLSFLMKLKDLPAAKDITLNPGNELIHNYLHHFTTAPELHNDFIELIREYHQSASVYTMNLFAEVMMGNLDYDAEKRLETFNSIVIPMKQHALDYNSDNDDDEDDWIEADEMNFNGYITLARLFDILPRDTAEKVGYQTAILYQSDWLTISDLLSPLGMSLAVFASFMPYEVMASQFEVNFRTYLETPNQDTMKTMVVIMDLLAPEAQLRLINLLLAETTNNNPAIQRLAFDSLIIKFKIVESLVAAERIQDLFDDINRDPFNFGRKMLSAKSRSLAGNAIQRNEFIDALLSEGQRENFVEKIRNTLFSIIATTSKYPLILARLSELLEAFCEEQSVGSRDIQSTFHNIIGLLFLPNGDNTEWEIDDTSKSLLAGVVEILFDKFHPEREPLRSSSSRDFHLYFIITKGILNISQRIGNVELVQKIVDSYLSLLNNPAVSTAFAEQICLNMNKPLQYILQLSAPFIKQDEGYELRTSIMKFFLKCLVYPALKKSGSKSLAKTIVEVSKKESELIEICKEALSVMNSIPDNEHKYSMKFDFIEVLKVILPFIRIEERFKLCALYTKTDSIQKALYAVTIKSNERQQEIMQATKIPADCCQIITTFENPTTLRL